MKQIFLSCVGLFMIAILSLPLLASEPRNKQIIDIDIEGMTCQFCAYGVQKSISELPGVEMAEVNIDTKKAHIVMSSNQQANVEQLKKKITDSGFKAVKIIISDQN